MPRRPKKTEGAPAPSTIRSFTRSGALSLMRVYRDKVGWRLAKNEPKYNEKLEMWEFEVLVPLK